MNIVYFYLFQKGQFSLENYHEKQYSQTQPINSIVNVDKLNDLFGILSGISHIFFQHKVQFSND